MNIDEVIRGDWASEPRVMEACLQVWHALSRQVDQLDHYTFTALAQLANLSDEQLVSRVLLYLATSKLKVLKTCLMYEFDGVFLELPMEEVQHYSKGETVIHPVFGEPIPDSQIMICFTPGLALKNARLAQP